MAPHFRFVIPLTCVVAITLSAASIPVSSCHATDADRPNILIIVGDDMGYADVGFHGCKDIPTPNLDKLANDGVRFTNGYVSGPYCSPTRAGLMTGRYQQRFGHEFNPGNRQAGLPVTEKTLADRLKGAGYTTALIGKWHMGAQPQFHPNRRGFDQFFGFLGGAHDYFKSEDLFRDDRPVSSNEYLTDAIARESVSFIQNQRQKPWLLCMTFNAVHTPLQADDDRLARFASIEDKTRRTYAAMMVAMDEAIGRVRKALDETDQTNRTVIAFISDNGGPTMPGTTMNGSINKPLRGSKRTTLEGGIRIPFLLTWPGRLKPAKYDRPVIQMDLHATALAVAGVQLPTEPKLDGVNLLPYLNGEKQDEPHRALFWRLGDQAAIRVGRYKLVRYDKNADSLSGERRQGSTNWKLYDLENDIGESNDLSETQSDKARELQREWKEWDRTLVEPLWDGRRLPTK
ncbi:MAG: sulfatase [Planctomycetes bacterium]|nr:sulfatase [Planctomycetota bacterium]